MTRVQIIGILAVIIGPFTYLERLMKMIGTLLIIGGIVLFLAEVYNKKMAAGHREKNRTIETR